MANELRVRTNFLGGLVEDNPLASGATTLTSAALASVPAIGSTQHLAVTLDPDGFAGAPEVVYVTAHSAGATTATILRAQEGTTARQHDRDMVWVHAVTVKDYDGSGGGAGLIGVTTYNPGAQATQTTTSTTFADVDAVNLVVSFVAPPSGKVLVRLVALSVTGNSTIEAWNLRSAGADVANTASSVTVQNCEARVGHAVIVTGLTAGTTYTYTWGHARTAGTSTAGIRYGGGAGPAVMEVWAVNL